MKANFTKKPIFQYLLAFLISFMVGLFAGKLAIPVVPTYATEDLSLSESTSETNLEQKSAIEEYALSDIATLAISTSAHTSASASSYSSAIPSYGLYMPSIGFYSAVSTAAVSGNTVQVPASGVARIANLLVGHNPGTFSAILGANVGDVFYLDGQAYQIYNAEVLKVSDNMRFVGKETTTTLSNGSKGLVLMTCYGEMKTFTNGVTSASHRYLIYAKAV